MTYARASFIWKGDQVFPGDPIDTSGVDESRIASMGRLRLVTADPDDVPIGPKHEKRYIEMSVAELRAEAETLGIDHDGLRKADLRDFLINHREDTD